MKILFLLYIKTLKLRKKYWKINKGINITKVNNKSLRKCFFLLPELIQLPLLIVVEILKIAIEITSLSKI